jgi:alpha-beta hydrolase superfamily lysophospholipase
VASDSPLRTTSLVLRQWPARGPARAAILGLHGFGDAGDLTFEGAAGYWSSRGVAVYALDQRGFGSNSSGRRWPGSDALIADAVAIARRVRARHPGRPLVVVGHSMGGGVALAGAAAGMEADALVLAGPAIAGGDALNPALRAAAWAAATLAPEKRWTGGRIVRIMPTDNPAALRRVASDPRHYADPSSRELWGLVRLMDRAAAVAPTVQTPTLTLMGVQDQVLAAEKVQSVHDRVPGAVGFVRYPAGWHWLFRDIQAERVWRDVADFVLSSDLTEAPPPSVSLRRLPQGTSAPRR